MVNCHTFAGMTLLLIVQLKSKQQALTCAQGTNRQYRLRDQYSKDIDIVNDMNYHSLLRLARWN